MNKKIYISNLIRTLIVFSCIICVTSCASQGVTSFEKKEIQDQTQVENEIKEEEHIPDSVDITLEGGSGKATILSPVETVYINNDLKVKLVWNSKNYDYMIVDGIRYDNENPGGDSTFTVKVDDLSTPLTVIADTTAMSVPHEIEYVIHWGPSADDSTGEEADLENRAMAFYDLPESLGGYEKSGEDELKYATCYTITRYWDYTVLNIAGSGAFLIVPEGKDIPEDIPEDMVVLKKPLDKTYLVSSSAMDLICKSGGLENIRLSGTKAEDWFVPEAAEAMQNNELIYAGKYRSPDYELILANGCNLAIENTMIYHEPAVKEKLEELGIPVLVETSSYESHPLGRLEWIKLYGVLFDKEKEASDYFEKQLALASKYLNNEPLGVSVAFFSVNASGMINVRKPGDYISKMIELAGGDYVIKNITSEDKNALSTMNMQMEDFYASAKDADIIIYNSTIEGERESIDELISKNGLFKDFKAVKNRQVYCAGRDLFQATTGPAVFMDDLNGAFKGEDKRFTFLKRLE